MKALSDANFKQNYELHLQHLKLKGLQPETIVNGVRSFIIIFYAARSAS